MMPDSNPTNMEVKYEELRALAEAATPGPWDWRANMEEGFVVHERPAGTIYSFSNSKENAAFIAAANPATVLALLAENGRLKETLELIDRNIRLGLNVETALKQVKVIVSDALSLREAK